MVQLFMMGMNINLILDDYFPCHEGSTDPIFSNANGNELWVLLLEKAFAKMNLNYENIIGGDPTESLRVLTGAPSQTFIHKQSPNVFDKILEGEKKDYVMCASTYQGSSVEAELDNGIVCGHAYSVLAAYELDTRYG